MDETPPGGEGVNMTRQNLDERLEKIRADAERASTDPKIVKELEKRSRELSGLSAKDMHRQFTF